MSLPNAVQGGTRPSALLIWYQDGTTVEEDLAGATLTGYIRNSAGTVRAITGDLTPISGGQFRWDYGDEDVADDGRNVVQFTATFASGQTPAKTFKTVWQVKPSLAIVAP